jgi:pyruvate dehydrogenase E1 component beta subunit
MALRRALSNDNNVVIFGEDVGINGGVFRATDGLKADFSKQVFDSPLAENLIAGLSVGMAAMGMRPVCEIQFMGFSYATFDQLCSHASRLRNRTRGRLTCPMVMRAPYGGGIHAPEHHSESFEAMYAHIPGLRVVIPSTPKRAYGLLLASIANNDPVVFLEPKRIYRKVKQDVIDDGQPLSLDTCFLEQEGEDLTLIAWGAMMHEAREAAQLLADKGVAVDLIDVATIKPIDMVTIMTSVQKTGRCVIVQESVKTCSIASEIAAQLAELCLYDLKAPVVRVSGFDTIMPLYRLENTYMPNAKQIECAALKTMETC